VGVAVVKTLPRPSAYHRAFVLHLKNDDVKKASCKIGRGSNLQNVFCAKNTYQNWTHKPPSDNGTNTTSSAECFDDNISDHSHKSNNNGVVGVAVHICEAPLWSYSIEEYNVEGSGGHGSIQDPASALSLSPSFFSSSEKQRLGVETV